jgi:hypothetical protein
LGAIRQVGPKPKKRRTLESAGCFKTLQENLMINHVKGCRDVEESQKSDLRLVNSRVNIRKHGKEGCFRRVISPIARLVGWKETRFLKIGKKLHGYKSFKSLRQKR